MVIDAGFLELAFQSQLSFLHQGSSIASITLHNPMPALMDSLNSCFYFLSTNSINVFRIVCLLMQCKPVWKFTAFGIFVLVNFSYYMTPVFP